MKPTLFTLLTFSLVATALSGCLGAPAGTPGLGDTVTVDWKAFDAHSGSEVASGSDLRFALGSGASGLGRDFERHLIGLAVGETFAFTSESDPSRPYGQVVMTPRDQIDPSDATATVDAATFTQAIGHDPVVGDVFEFNVFKAVVDSIENDAVTYTHVAHEAPLDSLGVMVVTSVDEGIFTIDLQALVGTTFVVQEPSPFNPGAPLEGLEPGQYRTRGMTDTHVLFDYTANPISADIDRPLRFEVTVTAYTDAAPQVFSEEGFAARRSPVLLADPAAVLTLRDADIVVAPAMESAEDDGHDHTH